MAECKAAVPLHTATPWAAPEKAAAPLSNSSTLSPVVSQSEHGNEQTASKFGLVNEVAAVRNEE